MPRYGISVKEILKKTIIVEAKNKKEAIERVEDAIWRSEIILDADDFDERVVSTSEYWVNVEIPDGEDISCYEQLTVAEHSD